MQKKIQNCDLKKMLKQKEDRLKKIQKDQNPFILSNIFTEQNVRKNLYTFNPSNKVLPSIKQPVKPKTHTSLTKAVFNKSRNNFKTNSLVKHQIEISKEYLDSLELTDKKDIIYGLPFMTNNQPYQLFKQNIDIEVNEKQFNILDEQFLIEQNQLQQNTDIDKNIKITTQQFFNKNINNQFDNEQKMDDTKNKSKQSQYSGRFHDLNCNYGQSKIPPKPILTQNNYYNGQKINKHSPDKLKKPYLKTHFPRFNLESKDNTKDFYSKESISKDYNSKQSSIEKNSKQSSQEKKDYTEKNEFTKGNEINICDQDLKLQELIKNSFKQQKSPANQIQNSVFFDKNVQKHLKQIETGEQAISFFAKYGNTTPIKFIYCQNLQSDQYRPYDLIVLKDQDVSKIKNDFYIITSLGIAHTNNKNQNKKSQKDISKVLNTNVVALSDWMNEATLFTIIKEINFFQNYTNLKIFSKWKNSAYRKIYQKTRQKLFQKCILSKIGFTSGIKQIIQILNDFDKRKLISENIFKMIRIWDIDDLKSDSKKAKGEQSQFFNIYVDKIINRVSNIVDEVERRNNIPDPQEENIKHNLQMSVPKLRKAVQEYQILIHKARQDKIKLRNLIRLADYMVLQKLYQINKQSNLLFLQELLKDNRKQGGLINSVCKFGLYDLSFTPDESEIWRQSKSIMKQSIKIMDNISRVLYCQSYSYLVNQHTNFDINEIIENSEWFVKAQESIKLKLKLDFEHAYQFVEENYEKCRVIENDIIYISDPKNHKIYYNQEYDQQQTREILQKMVQWQNLQELNLRDFQKGIINVQSNKIKIRFQKHLDYKIKFFINNLYQIIRDLTVKSLNSSLQISEQLTRFPNTLQEYGKYIEISQSASLVVTEIQEEKILIDKLTLFIRKFDNSIISQQDIIQTTEINSILSELTPQQNNANKFIKDKLPDYGEKMEKAYIELQKDIQITDSQVNTGHLVISQINEQTTFQRIMKDLTQPKQQLVEFNQRIEKFKEKYTNLNSIAKLMNKITRENKELNALQLKYNDRKSLWDAMEEYKECAYEWQNSQFLTLNVEEIEQKMKNFEHTIISLKIRIHNLSDTLKDNLLDIFINEIREMQILMPLISPLGNKDMETRHWKQIFETLRPDYNPGKFFSLNDLIQEGIKAYQELIDEISIKATGEALMASQLENIQKKWEELKFQVVPYADQKDRYKIIGVDEILITLEDNSMNIQTMLGTRFVNQIRQKVEEWEKKLLLISEIIDEWLNCQRSWMYLENIFNAPDIQTQLPQEAKKFLAVDKFFTNMMLRTFKQPIVQNQCSSEELLHKFQANNKILDDIQKCLEKYLDSKRIDFPRFYFLSNDELLQILSQTRNPQAVQPHLKKCFDNIMKIQFTDVQDSREVISMQSVQPESMPEVIQFIEPVLISQGEKVETWLMKIQLMMIESIQELSKRCLNNYDRKKRKEWLLSKLPAQSYLLIECIKWQEVLTQTIMSKNQNSFTQTLNDYDDILFELIDFVRTDLNLLQRTLICTLLVIDVHLRDVILMLKAECNIKIEDFIWIKQLRYYWQYSNNEIDICQTNAKLTYSYEYLGNGPRLVMTPLTDNTYLTMTSALHMFYGGCPQGPAGTGKTETIKDLAKAVAIQCVVFNCSENIDFRTMERLFSGLAQCGAWACFDEFNRINIEVLSVIAQQIHTIQTNVKKKEDRFMFEGTEISLDFRFGLFVTMNPGYAGRSELPDNLKALLRPIAMMIPDYELIGEIMFMSDGFQNARLLSQKMICLFRLCSEQLSKAKHYDFGMRAVKSVLTMAGMIRRQNSQNESLTEEIILIRAIQESNVPKFLDQDLPLFLAIIHDLFPKVEMQNQEFTELKQEAISYLSSMNYQASSNFITKVFQLMETQRVRHGVMLVGSTGVGKSTVFNTLRHSIIQLYQQGYQDPMVRNIILSKLNPKSVSINNLYGYVNNLTNEWNDGIVANIVRDAVENNNQDMRWLQFDGPVDSLWIENLNTVLDENKMLCLSNGQRIKLPSNFIIFFEVIDLIQASPATVSRCGMIYFDQKLLPWKAIIQTWVQLFKKTYVQDQDSIVNLKVFTNAIKNLQARVENLFQENLDFINNECKQAIKSIDNNLVQTCIEIIEHLFENLLEHIKGIQNIDKLSAMELDNYFTMIIIFAFIWSAGGNIYDSIHYQGRSKYSKFIKSKILGFYTGFPFEGEIYDYYIDFQQRKFVPWTNLIQKFVYDPKKQFYDIIVPTNETVKYEYLINLTIVANQHILLSGNSGVGKSQMIMNYISNLGETYQSQVLNFSAQTTSQTFQEHFYNKDKYARKTKDKMAPTNQTTMVIFIDDFNLPQMEQYGAQPPIELLIQIIDHGGFYDLKKLFFIKIINLIFILACSPSGGGRKQTTPRLFRHFNMIWISDIGKTTFEQIYSEILVGHFNDLKIEDLDQIIKSMVLQSVDIYQKICQELLPIPSKCHYTFNSRDLAKLFQGILQLKLQYIEKKQDLLNLWMHELQRVFYDRLISLQDREFVLELIREKLKDEFSLSLEIHEIAEIKFVDFNNDDNDYLYTRDSEKLQQILNDKITLFNSEKTKPMNLIFFKDAINNICRICRVLRNQRGNSLLIGVGGTGRTSLALLGSYISGLSTFQIQIFQGYKEQQWKDDFKNLIKQTGSKNIPTLFLFSDTQILYESFLQDISNILNGGEFLNMMVHEDLEEIFNDLRLILKDKGIQDSKENMIKQMREFIDQNLHFILTFSPVGDKLRHRCNQFPAIINCTTIIWFDQWTNEALFMIAEKEYQQQENLGISQYKTQLAELSVQIHNDVIESCNNFLLEQKRHVYTTPTSYLDLIKLYIQLLKINQNILPLQIRKYTIGLQTLKDTNNEVAKLQNTIFQFQPILQDNAEQNKKLIGELSVQTKLSKETEEIISSDTIQAQKTRDEVKILQVNCQKEYEEAIPILEQAQEAVKDIDKTQLQILKTFKQPHPIVRITLEATCLLFDYEQSWEAGKRYLLGDIKFQEKLINFDIEQVDEKRFVKLRKKYLSNPELNITNLEKVSTAASQIFKWLKAIDEYEKVKKMIDPRKKKLEEAQDSLNLLDRMLIEKTAQLKEIQIKISELNENLTRSLDKEKSYAYQMVIAQKQLERAELLAQGLNQESDRWTQANAILSQNLENLTGNILISASLISYLGPFASSYRQNLLHKWVEMFFEQNIPTANDFDIVKILSNESEIQEWCQNLLPNDDYSIQNAISIINTKKSPLIIDPQNQASRWIKRQYDKKQLKISSFSDNRFYKNLESCIKFGVPLLVEGVKEELDPILDPVLYKQIFKKGIQSFILLGDQEITYNMEFQIIFCTKMANPHYLPEIFIKTNLINFTVNMVGLEDQLLVEVVTFERNDLEVTRLKLMNEILNDEKIISKLEDQILQQIGEAQGKMLDNDELINTLKETKQLSKEIEVRIQESKITQEEIKQAREQYRIVAKRGSILYFSISEMSLIDPMYQWSLDYFMNIYKQRLQKSEQSKDLQKRLSILIQDITVQIYQNISKGLFSKDRLFFSFLIAIKVQIREGIINESELNFFVRRSTTLNKRKEVNFPYFIDRKYQNQLLNLMDTNQTMEQLINEMSSHQKYWQELMDYENPFEIPPPLQFDEFYKLQYIKILRQNCLVQSIQQYIQNLLGSELINSPSFNLKSAFDDSTKKTPIIFILSSGADPMSYLYQFEKEQNLGELQQLTVVSLGQGQGEKASELIQLGKRCGDWICLQNCHLAISWLPTLEKILDSSNDLEIHKDFRLWLTSMPTQHFPVSILQQGIKITNEPPRGIKQNLLQTIENIDEEEYNASTYKYQKLILSLAFFHTIILERKKFGAIGWNTNYDWMLSDYNISLFQIKEHLNENDQINYNALNIMIGEINYGGRVTDHNDMILVKSIMKMFINQGIEQGQYKFYDSYESPQNMEYNNILEYIKSMPLQDNPEIFGLNQNANITSKLKISDDFLFKLQIIAPNNNIQVDSNENPEVICISIINQIYDKIKGPLKITENTTTCSLLIVRNQELSRYNILINEIKNSILELKRALMGKSVMNQELELMYDQVMIGKVPRIWLDYSYLSLKPLQDWVSDLLERLEFWNNWIIAKYLDSYLISAFYFPQGFITAIKQTFSRKMEISMDNISIKTELKDGFYVPVEMENGACIFGIYLQGCRINDDQYLDESHPKELVTQIPYIILNPVITDQQENNNEKFYNCPFYKTANRHGDIDSTGLSTNYIMKLNLRTKIDPQVWIRRGVAILCQIEQ